MSAFAVRTKFTMFIRGSRSSQQRLMRAYSQKFSSLMVFCRGRKMKPGDYAHLPALRAFVRGKTLSEVTAYLSAETVTSPEYSRVVDIAPVFDRLPNDLRAFIMLAIGIRQGHLAGGLASPATPPMVSA